MGGAVYLVKTLIEATIHIIRATSVPNLQNDSSQMGDRNTVPIDIRSFNYLAKTVNNLILTSQKMRNELVNKLTMELKDAFFTQGLHRLSGGIDMTEEEGFTKPTLDEDLADGSRFRIISTDTFTI